MTYAEPELVTGLQGYSGGPLLGGGGPVGPGVIGMSGPSQPRFVGGGIGIGGGGGPERSGSHYSSSLLMQGGANKFNTIHSSVNKRNNSAGMALNHYERDGPPLGSGIGPSGLVGGNNGQAYHMSTLGRSSSVKGPRDPLLPNSSGSSSAGSGSGNPILLKNLPTTSSAAKVVDSAYGTTRSSKKVYL